MVRSVVNAVTPDFGSVSPLSCPTLGHTYLTMGAHGEAMSDRAWPPFLKLFIQEKIMTLLALLLYVDLYGFRAAQ